MSTEANLKRAIIAKLKRIPDSKVIDMHRSGRSERGIPDIQFIVCGCPFFFEAKVDRNKPTKLQLLRMEELRHARARVFVVRSVDEALREVWLLLKEKASYDQWRVMEGMGYCEH